MKTEKSKTDDNKTVTGSDYQNKAGTKNTHRSGMTQCTEMLFPLDTGKIVQLKKKLKIDTKTKSITITGL